MSEHQTPYVTNREKKIAEIREGLTFIVGEQSAGKWMGRCRFLLSELERLEREYAEERAAHNAHVTELCELEEENRKLRKDIERIIEILKNGQQAHWQTFKIRQLLEVPLE